MNTSCPTVPPATSARPAPAARAVTARMPAPRGLFASIERIINAAGLASVDLTDTVFVSLPRREGAPYEAVVPPSCSE